MIPQAKQRRLLNRKRRTGRGSRCAVPEWHLWFPPSQTALTTVAARVLELLTSMRSFREIRLSPK